VDADEISTRCLSYSHDTQDVEISHPESGTAREHVPLLPDTSPHELYTRLFEGFSPGSDAEALANRLAMKQSVLDSAVREIDRLATLLPATERDKLDAHAQAIRELERALSDSVNAQPGECPSVPEPDPARVALTGGATTSYANPVAESSDTERVQQLGELFFLLIRTAFQCDLARVATFQWCPSTNHMAFADLNPQQPELAYAHHPFGSTLPSQDLSDPLDSELTSTGEFLVGAQLWFNRRLADALVTFKDTNDVYGGSLLDSTLVPFMTEKAHMQDAWNNVPSLILGGRGLGMQGGQYMLLGNRPHNDVWMTVAQALLGTADPLALLAGENFYQDGVAPIDGLWSPPA
jgi:hypothetical protein